MRRRAAVAVAAAVAAVVSHDAGPDQPITSSVRYTREIVRIVQRKCLPCHAPGALSMSLADYHAVRSWGRAIREEILEERMPPWPAAPGYGHFQNDLALTARERTTLLAWIDGGMPRGDAADLPAPTAEADGLADDPPDRRYPAPPQAVPANADDLVRRITIPTGLTAPRRVQRVVVKPGDRRVVRGALVFVEGTGLWLGGWLPWQAFVAPPEGHAFLLPARARLTVVLYYRGGDEPVVDRSSVELYFARPSQGRAVRQLVVDGRVRDLRLEKAATVWAIHPAPSATARSLELRARLPNGAIQVLLWMPRCLPEWPEALVLQQPAELPAGTTVSLIAHGDGESKSCVVLSSISTE
jgi:hypothetical protein